MADWRERLREEYKQVTERVSKLGTFLCDDDNLVSLSQQDILLLKLQHHYMTAYYDILCQRIDRLGL